MSAESDILEGLCRHLGTMAGQTLPVAYPGVSFDPPKDAPDGKYLRVTFLPVPTDTFQIGMDDKKEYSGLLQIDVMWPQGEGLTAPTEYAEGIIGHYAMGIRIQENLTEIQINEKPWLSPSLESPPNLQLPINIPYQSFTS